MLFIVFCIIAIVVAINVVLAFSAFVADVAIGSPESLDYEQVKQRLAEHMRTHPPKEELRYAQIMGDPEAW